MQHIDPLIGSVTAMLWLAHVYGQYQDLAWIFAVISKLRHARKARGWSIEEAAWLVGVDTSTYHRWELGWQRPHQGNLHKLEAAFQMREAHLFENEHSQLDIAAFGAAFEAGFQEAIASSAWYLSPTDRKTVVDTLA